MHYHLPNRKRGLSLSPQRNIPLFRTVPGRYKQVLFLVWMGSFLPASAALAQKNQDGPGLPAPHLYGIMPIGGRGGSTFEMTVTGTDIEEPQGLLFSQPGIRAEPIVPPAPPPPDPKKPSPPAPKKAAAKKGPMAEAKFKVSIPTDTPVGIHDVRIVNKWGVSNPRAFVVGDLAEVLEKEPNNDVPQAQRVELNRTVNGAISTPTDVDYYVFAGKRGQRVVISCLASSIDSRLRAALELYDSAGRQLAFNRRYQENDALLDCTLPEDGDYYVRLYEFTHTQGSAEHFYRLSLSTTPWIDAVAPVMVEPGKTTLLTVYGRNLPGGQPEPAAVQDGRVLEKTMMIANAPNDPTSLQRLAFAGYVPPRSAALDGFEFRLRNAAGTSNPFLLTYARAPVVLSNEMNHRSTAAQPIVLPCEVSGSFTHRRQRDWYAFAARKGEVYRVEILSDRLGAPTDIYFALRRPDTKQRLANLDDNPEILSSTEFYNRTEDPPAYRFVVPADGQYRLMIASFGTETRAGPRHFYRVRITPELPDFHLIVLPPGARFRDGCCIRQGGNASYTVLVWRQDGFKGPVTLNAESLPTDVSCPPQVVGPSLKQAALVLSADPDAPEWTGEIKIKGTALINGQTVVREARPASITWPIKGESAAGIPAISRLDRSLVIAVRDQAPFHLTAAASQTTVVAGSKLNVMLKLARLWPELKGDVSVAPVNAATCLPDGLILGNNNKPITIAAGKEDASLAVTVKSTVTPGSYNLVLRGTTELPFSKDPAAKQKGKIKVSQPADPITLTVLPNQVAKLTVKDPHLTLKVGAQTELRIKVARLHAYAGAFKVRLVLPAGIKGIAAEETTIPAGQDEAKILLRAPADAKPGNRMNLVVQAVATLNGNTPLTHEARINVNVVK
jgi:hypothetical protein